MFSGDSAGGNLVAAVTLKLRNIGIQPQPKLQVLIYPTTQGIDMKLPSQVEHKDHELIGNDLVTFGLDFVQHR